MEAARLNGVRRPDLEKAGKRRWVINVPVSIAARREAKKIRVELTRTDEPSQTRE